MSQISEGHLELEKQLRSRLETEMEGSLFEPLTQEGKEEFRRMIQRMAKRRFEMLGYSAPFKVICDETNNTPEDVENGNYC
jgi:hypothetical protein